MTFFADLEATCARVVERAFAVAFPSAIEPVQIARKLVASFESQAAGSGRGGRRFMVLLSAPDFARFEPDRAYLERQWSVMLARLAERSGRPQRAPEVLAQTDATVATGTVTIAVETLPEPKCLLLRVRKGMPPGTVLPLQGASVVGRDAGCQLILLDPRVSRRHLEIFADGDSFCFRDLGSANGTRLNGTQVDGGVLGAGDVLALGDSELLVEAGDDA